MLLIHTHRHWSTVISAIQELTCFFLPSDRSATSCHNPSRRDGIRFVDPGVWKAASTWASWCEYLAQRCYAMNRKRLELGRFRPPDHEPNTGEIYHQRRLGVTGISSVVSDVVIRRKRYAIIAFRLLFWCEEAGQFLIASFNNHAMIVLLLATLRSGTYFSSSFSNVILK